ncbi:hypothetical protein QQX98_002825 [Neonectria punicea]|uniref:DUF7779 domain-containing protein n=1 Tax=Neonectria punicea TaxID=979145 RepID=A0ABR1HGZ3_9HYPO
MRVSKAAFAQAELEAAIVANVCQKFEEIGLDVPILSVYGDKKTKTGVSLFKLGKEVVCICMAILTNSTACVGPSIISDDAWETTVASEAGLVVGTSSQTPLGGTMGSSSADFEIIPVIKDFSKKKALPNLPAYYLHQQERNPDFFGRGDVLREMDKILLPQDKTTKMTPSGSPQGIRYFALCGLGGVGKSQIALEFVHSRKTKFDAVFWISADTKPKLDESYEQVAVSMGLLDATEARDLVISRSILLEWLTTPEAKPRTNNQHPLSESTPEFATWLMVLDNADDLEILDDFWPPAGDAGSGSILITSRDPLAKKFRRHVDSGWDLCPFRPEDAESFIQKLSGNQATVQCEQDSMKKLSEHLGGMPLVMAQLAAVIKRKDLTYTETFDMVVDDDPLVDPRKLKMTQAGSAPGESLAATWALSQLSAQVLRLLELLSILDPDSIHDSVLVPEGSLAVSEDYPPSKDAYYTARMELWKSSLVTRNKELGLLSLHRVTQDVVIARMSEERRQETFQFAMELLRKAWPQGPMLSPTSPQHGRRRETSTRT